MVDLVPAGAADPVEFTPATLSQLTHEALLQLIYKLEHRDAGPGASDYDHRKYLKRHELERLATLLIGLRRNPSNLATILSKDPFADRVVRIDPSHAAP